MAGGEAVQFNNSIYLAEKGSVDRDFALTYFLRENQCFPPGADIKRTLELYFQVLFSPQIIFGFNYVNKKGINRISCCQFN